MLKVIIELKQMFAWGEIEDPDFLRPKELQSKEQEPPLQKWKYLLTEMM